MIRPYAQYYCNLEIFLNHVRDRQFKVVVDYKQSLRPYLP